MSKDTLLRVGSMEVKARDVVSVTVSDFNACVELSGDLPYIALCATDGPAVIQAWQTALMSEDERDSGPAGFGFVGLVCDDFGPQEEPTFSGGRLQAYQEFVDVQGRAWGLTIVIDPNLPEHAGYLPAAGPSGYRWSVTGTLANGLGFTGAAYVTVKGHSSDLAAAVKRCRAVAGLVKCVAEKRP